ncbi:MAG TPA: hypothetical protein VG819_08195 [Rhizomicrobium sp.]|jgi:hypothetical protein|nr:hypothetical protein [Rhizomicrobium sp.]
MSFREKGAWIVVLTNLGVYGFYFLALAAALAEGRVDHAHFIGLLARSIALLVCLIVTLHVAVAILAPRDANAPRDEREKLIALKGARAAYFVLAATAVAAIWEIIVGLDTFLLANVLFFGLVAAEVVQNGIQILHYRRGV